MASIALGRAAAVALGVALLTFPGITFPGITFPGIARRPAFAQEPQAADATLRVFPADRPSQDQRLLRPARTTDTRAEWKPELDPVRWSERVKEIETRVRVALGLWPHPSAGYYDLDAGAVDCGDYVILKRSFMGHWFYFLAANVYMPKQMYEGAAPGLAPVVVIPSGEWDGGRLQLRSEEAARALVERGEERDLENARRPYQALAAQLARMGCLVYVYDVTGAGESDLLDAQRDFSDRERLARCQGILGWRVWETFQALNQAWNWPGVDQQRVAFIGNQGGAELGVLFALQEPRFKAAVALNWVGALNQGEALNENAPHLRVGTSNLEIAATLAPRAMYLASSGARACAVQEKCAPLLAEQWAVLGRPDGIEFACRPDDETPFGVHVREGIYAFLNRELALGASEPIRERPIEFVRTADLAVHPIGKRVLHEIEQPPQDALPRFTELSDANLDNLIHEETAYRAGIFKTWIGAALKVLLDTELPRPEQVASRLAGYERRADRALLRLVLGRTGTGEEVPAILVLPDRWNHTLVVGVSGGGKRDFFGGGVPSSLSDAARVVDQGAAFLALDPLLTGEFLNVARPTDSAPALPVDRTRHAQSIAYTSGYNRTLIGQRVHDILTAIAFARSIDGVQRVHLVGTGEGGTWALLARALAGDETVARTAAQWSFDFADLESPDDPNFLPGGVRYGDMEYFASLVAPAELCIVAGPGEEPIGIPEHVMRTYNALAQGGRVRSAGSADYPAVIDWLAGSVE